jgi:dynein heavy chain
VSAQGPAEDWLVSLLSSMRQSVHGSMLQVMGSVAHAARNGCSPIDSDAVLRRLPGGATGDPNVRVNAFTSHYSVQVQVMAFRVLWTLQCEAALAAAAKERHAVTALGAHVGRQLSELVEFLALVKAGARRAGASSRSLSVRRKLLALESLITLQLSHSDATQGLIAAAVRSPAAFDFQKHLRSYLRDGELRLQITDIVSRYSNEFVGHRPLLVVTQLTLRCMVTLVQALVMGFGGAPLGPAGTGAYGALPPLP